MRLLRGGTLRRYTPTCRLARARPAGQGGGLSEGGGGVDRGEKQRKGGRRGARAARVDSRYTAAASVSAMSARSDFYNAPCTLPHSRSLTPSHPPPRRGAEDPRERRASASVSRGDLWANVRERTNRRTSDRASRERVFLGPIWRFQRDIC